MVALTRRALLARGVAGGLVLAGCGASDPPAPSAAEHDVGLLQRAHESELRSAALYAALVPQRGARRRLAERLTAAEERHAAALDRAVVELGGRPSRLGALPSGGAGLGAALGEEDRSVGFYLDLLPRLRTPATRTLVGFILAEEAAHAAALRAALGRDPAPAAFA